MAPSVSTPALSDLPFVPYLTPEGEIPTDHQGKVGIYAIFDQGQTLQYVGYSRDVYQSLKQHLVRQPQACHWYKVQTIDRPSRSLLETIRTAWIDAEGLPQGNQQEAAWTAAIDAKASLTPAEQGELATLEPGELPRYLKNLARRREAEILATLAQRGVTMAIRFNPKLKEQGLLDLK